MEIITYPIENEVEATRIASMFDSQNIPYTIKENSDLVPYNGERRPYAELLVLREFEKQAQAIFDEIAKSKTVTVPQQEALESESDTSHEKTTSKQHKSWQPYLIIYSLVITVLLIKYWDMNRKNSQSKNFEYTWNLDNTELVIRSKKDQHLIQIFSDTNYDLNFEKVEGYSTNATLNYRSKDFDEDGFVDEIIYYGKNGKISGRSTDLDSDGLTEKYIIILETGDTLKLIDKNHDGFFMQEKR